MKKQFLGLHWKEHLLYATLLLAACWFFQHKNTEQARLHGIMEAVIPLAAQAISNWQNSKLMAQINFDADAYITNKTETYRARAKVIQNWVEISCLELERIAGTPDVEYQRKELAPLLEQLAHFPDSILLACDSNSASGHRLRQIFSDQFLGIAKQSLLRAEQPELARLANALSIRAELAANTGLRYCFAKVKKNEVQYAHIPVLYTDQPCPRVGEAFEAEIRLESYIVDPAFEVEINGQPVVSDNGLVHFEQRFARPGMHKIRASFVRQENEVGRKHLYEQEFIVEVSPR